MINITQALQITCIPLSSGMCGAAYAHRDGDQRGGPAIIWDNEAGDGLFFKPMNWDPDGVPGLNDEALISMGGPVTAANMPIEVERLTVQSGLNLESSSIQVQFLSSVNNLITTGCCATGIDSGIEKLIIKGDSFLFKRAIFLGASTELQDTTTFFDGSTIRADSSLSIKGEAIYASNVHSMEAMGEVDIDGTLNLQTATLFSSGNPGAQWVFNSGTLMASGTGESNVSDQLSMTNGLILADGAQLDINQRYEITDSEARVLNNGTLRFLNGSTSDPYKLGITTFDGNGRIVIDGNQVKLDPSSGITIASVEGTGLEIRGSLRMLGELSNTKNMRLNGGVIDSDVGFGRLTCDAGTLTVQSNSTCLTEIVIRSGATMSIDARLSLLGEIRIDPGALLLLNSVIGPPPTTSMPTSSMSTVCCVSPTHRRTVLPSSKRLSISAVRGKSTFRTANSLSIMAANLTLARSHLRTLQTPDSHSSSSAASSKHSTSGTVSRSATQESVQKFTSATASVGNRECRSMAIWSSISPASRARPTSVCHRSTQSQTAGSITWGNSSSSETRLTMKASKTPANFPSMRQR